MSEQQAQVVITGGAGDLATAIADEFTRSGQRVVAPAREALDVSSADAIKDYFRDRQPELLVCNAGITRDAPLGRVSASHWDEVWAVNYEGARRCAVAAIPSMRGRGGGHVVMISSFSALHPPLGQVAYATAKAALLGLVSDLAARHGSDNIRINAILPGFLETRLTAAVSGKRRRQVLDHHTLERFNSCDAVARFIRFLHLEMPHTSGQVFQLDSRLDRW